MFNYSIGETSYASINDGYMNHVPLFLEELNVTQDVIDMCQGNPSCIYDSIATGNTQIGLSTLGVSMNNDAIVMTLSKFESCIASYLPMQQR